MSHNNSDKQRVQEQFGQNAEKYVSSEGHAQGTDLTLAVEWLQPAADDVVLDIATGGGHVAKTLAPLVRNVMVTDLTAVMLEIARSHLTENGVQKAHYVVADAEELPFLKNSFDIVTCRIAPHHFPDPDAFVREVARVLRPGGQFLLIDNVVPNDKTLGDFINLAEAIRDPSHIRCLSIVEWKDLLAKYGLNIQQNTLRKKMHPFESWVNRMAPTDAHRFAVSTMLLQVPQDVKSYFEVAIKDETVVSFTTDQWIALAVSQKS